jgi:hypothetical protein
MLHKRAAELQAEVRNAFEEFNDMRSSVSQQHSKKAASFLEMKYKSLVNMRLDEYHMRHLTATDFGEGDAMIALAMGPCIESGPITEKELKGGTSNTVTHSSPYSSLLTCFTPPSGPAYVCLCDLPVPKYNTDRACACALGYRAGCG